MSDVQTPLAFNDAVNLLDAYTKQSFVSDVWVPSLKKVIKIKELNAKQQKSLLSFALDSSSNGYKPFFTKAIYQILIENALCEKSVIDNLTFFDRLFISVAMKSQVSDSIRIDFSTTEEEKNDTNSEDVILSELISKFSDYTHPSPENLLLEKNGTELIIRLVVPTIKREVEYFENMPLYKTNEGEEGLKAFIADAYLYETSKYIENISIANNDLFYNTLSIKQKIAMVEKLPAAIIQSIIDKISTWKTYVDSFLTVTSSTGVKKILEIDTTLFLSN